jgi:Flp pilus assembly protein CpaB
MGNLRGFGLILLAALLAAGAGMGFYMRLKAATPTQIETIPIVVASKDITFGTKLAPEDLMAVEFPAGSVPAAAYSMVDSVLGHTTEGLSREG